MAEPSRGLQRRRSSSGASRVLEAAMNAIKGETGSDMARHVQLNTGHAPKTWKDSLPKLTVKQWWHHYRDSPDPRSLLVGDISAGIIIAVFLIPQGMAYAQLAGVPAIHGLYSAIFALLTYPWFSTAPQLSVGPVAVVSLLSNAAVALIATEGTARFTQLSMMLALLCGVIQLVLGALRAGFLVNFLSHPVLTGFTSAAAFIIGSSQLGKLLGVELGHSKYAHVIFYEAALALKDIHLLTVAVAVENLVLFALIMWGKRVLLRWYPEGDPRLAMKRTLVSSIPTALIVVVVNILLVIIFDLDSKGVAVLGHIPSGLPAPGSVFDGIGKTWWNDMQTLAVPALVMSLVGFMEAVSIAKAMSLKYRDCGIELEPTQELYGIGLANLTSCLFNGFPVTGGFARTPLNGSAGARTPLASFVTAFLLLFVVLALTSLFEKLPQATLAATICVAVTGLLDFHTPKLLWQVSRPDLLVLGTAFFATLVLGIEEGVLVACVLSLAIVIKQTTSPHWALLGRLPHTTMWHNISRFPDAKPVRGIAVVQFDSRLYFANASVFQHLILDVAADVSRQGEPPYLRHFSTQDAEDPTTLQDGSASVASFEVGDNGSVILDGSSVIGAVGGASVAGDLHHNLQVHDDDGETGGEQALVVHGRHDTQGRRVMHGLEVLNFPAGTRHVVVDMGAVSSIDFSAMHMLTDLPKDLARACLSNVKLWLVNMRGPTRDALRRMLNKVAAIRMKEVAKAAKALMRQKYARGMRPPTPNTAIELSMFSTPGGESRSKEPVLDRRLFCLDVHESVQFLLCQHPERPKFGLSMHRPPKPGPSRRPARRQFSGLSGLGRSPTTPGSLRNLHLDGVLSPNSASFNRNGGGASATPAGSRASGVEQVNPAVATDERADFDDCGSSSDNSVAGQAAPEQQRVPEPVDAPVKQVAAAEPSPAALDSPQPTAAAGEVV